MTQAEFNVLNYPIALQEIGHAAKSDCDLCDKGFPVEEGEHYGTQSLGMIPTTRCARLTNDTSEHTGASPKR